MPDPNKHQVARAGEHFVAAELHRRGAYAVTFAGNMPEVDLFATNTEQTRTVALQIKTKRRGTWQATAREWTSRLPEIANLRFWIFVNLKPAFRSSADESVSLMPSFYVVPEAWIQANITEYRDAYLARREAAGTPASTSRRHSIAPRRIHEWLDRWDILQIV